LNVIEEIQFVCFQKIWCQLVRRAIERRDNGEATKRGKRKNFRKKNISQETLNKNEDKTELNFETLEEASNSNSNDGKFLKTLTQFVTHEGDENNLGQLIQEQFSIDPSSSSSSPVQFGIVGLHTCGNLGVDSLKIFLTNEGATFLLNVPCCYHLLDENEELYPDKKFKGSKQGQQGENLKSNNTKASFPLSEFFNREESKEFFLGRNARMMCAYSVEKMVANDKVKEFNCL